MDIMTDEVFFTACRMFKHACAFVDCAKYCEKEPNNVEYRLQSHTVSGIVNSAFACEVFLKSLLVYHGVSIEELHDHKLKKLWGMFKEKDQEITQQFEQNIREWYETENDNLFDELLENISNSFAYWRYIYEKRGGSIDLNFLRVFRDSLKEICCKKLYGKTWDEYIGKSNCE